MRRHRFATDSVIARLYLDKHLTMKEIGEKFGVTRQAVWRRIHKADISVADALHVRVKCQRCGKILVRLRSRIKKGLYKYCSLKCWREALKNL